MDGRTRRKLQQISAESAAKWQKDLVITSDPHAEVRAGLLKQAQNASLPKSVRAHLSAMAESEGMNRLQRDVDPEVGKHIEREMEARIKSAIKRGDLKPPKHDDWTKKHFSRFN